MGTGHIATICGGQWIHLLLLPKKHPLQISEALSCRYATSASQHQIVTTLYDPRQKWPIPKVTGPHLIHSIGFVGPHESKSQTTSRSIHLFLHSTYIDTQTMLCVTSVAASDYKRQCINSAQTNLAYLRKSMRRGKHKGRITMTAETVMVKWRLMYHLSQNVEPYTSDKTISQ